MKRFDKWEYTCCFDVHVFKCVKFWAVFDILASLIIPIVAIFIFGPDELPNSLGGWFNFAISNATISYSSIIFILRPVLTIIPDILALYGVFTKKARAFLPYLIVNGFILLLYPILLLVDIIKVISHFNKRTNSQGMGAVGFFTFVFALLLYFIFYKAYKYLKEIHSAKTNDTKDNATRENTGPGVSGVVIHQPLR